MDLRTAVKKLYNENFQIKIDDKILIITDSRLTHLVNILEEEGSILVETTRVRIRKKRADSSPIPEAGEALQDATVIVAPTGHSISHSPEITAAIKRGARVASMPGVTERIFLLFFETDQQKMRKLSQELTNRLEKAQRIKITCPLGTNFTCSITPKRPILQDNGDLSKPSSLGNIPAGEVALAPIETSGEGTVVFSHSLKTEGPAKIVVANGRITSGDAAAKPMMDWFDSHAENLNIAEFAIGIHDTMPIVPNNTMINEKRHGTVHIAFGENRSLGGVNEAPIHNDLVIENPTLYVGGRVVIRKGNFV